MPPRLWEARTWWRQDDRGPGGSLKRQGLVALPWEPWGLPAWGWRPSATQANMGAWDMRPDQSRRLGNQRKIGAFGPC